MADGFPGETVILLAKTKAGVDRYNKQLYDTVEMKIPGTLVAPGPRADAIAPNRPDGVEINYTLFFLKGVEIKRNDTIVVRGIPCKTVGNPARYSLGNVPTAYDLVVEVTASSG